MFFQNTSWRVKTNKSLLLWERNLEVERNTNDSYIRLE